MWAGRPALPHVQLPKHPLWPRITKARASDSQGTCEPRRRSPPALSPPRSGGGGSGPAARGPILTGGRGRRAQEHRAEQQRQPDVDLHPILRGREPPRLPRPAQPQPPHLRLAAASQPLFLLRFLLRPFPGRPGPARSQSSAAAQASWSNGRARPAPLMGTPPMSSLSQSPCTILTPALSVGPRPHRHGPS